MISTLLDTDMYKFPMGVHARKIKNNIVEIVFKCRNKVDITMIRELLEEAILKFIDLKFDNEDIDYLNGLTDGKCEFLREFTETPLPIKFSDFKITVDKGELNIRVRGPWWSHIYIEVPVLAMVNELYNQVRYTDAERLAFEIEGDRRLSEKIALLNQYPDMKIMEFGTRRRYSKAWQRHVLSRLINETKNVIGTSNVSLAKEFGIPAMGTMAHEVFQYYQGIVHPLDAQSTLLENWADEWGDKYLIALTDIYPQKKFLKDFNQSLALRYAGVRHDSGDPKQWVREIIQHYKDLGIDPRTKKAVFSDGLTIPLCIEIYLEFGDQIQCVFGIGTNLTNDMGDDHIVLQIVMKIVTVDGRAVAKISNNPDKSMCEDSAYVKWLISAITNELDNWNGGK